MHSPNTTPPQSQPKGHTLIAWLIIVITCAVIVVGNMLSQKPESAPAATSDPAAQDDNQSIDVLFMTFISQVFVGQAELAPTQMPRQHLYNQNAAQLQGGSISQRLRFVVLAAELAGTREARRQLSELDDFIQTAQASNEQPILSQSQAQVYDILQRLYPPQDDADSPQPIALDQLTTAERDLLIQELGWFGDLALNPQAASTDPAARAAVLKPATTAVIAVAFMIILACLAFVAGVITLIVILIKILRGSIRSALAPGPVHHGIYAETFAIWLILFIALQFIAEPLSIRAEGSELLLSALAFFASLSALAWPVIRGIPWSQVRADIGLTLGRNPAAEPVVGVFGYLMALPMLAVGIALMFVLIVIDDALFGSGGTEQFGPSGGPSHPIVEMLTPANWWQITQVLLVASVAAPIVEEIMFRGVLYRHLRSATDPSQNALNSQYQPDRARRRMSIVLSAAINSFIFAVIHPQGFLAVPALMSLAIAFTFVREWRSTLVPAIIMHAISNGLIMTMLFTIISIASWSSA